MIASFIFPTPSSETRWTTLLEIPRVGNTHAEARFVIGTVGTHSDCADLARVGKLFVPGDVGGGLFHRFPILVGGRDEAREQFLPQEYDIARAG